MFHCRVSEEREGADCAREGREGKVRLTPMSESDVPSIPLHQQGGSREAESENEEGKENVWEEEEIKGRGQERSREAVVHSGVS